MLHALDRLFFKTPFPRQMAIAFAAAVLIGVWSPRIADARDDGGFLGAVPMDQPGPRVPPGLQLMCLLLTFEMKVAGFPESALVADDFSMTVRSARYRACIERGLKERELERR
jgi:hypothetical protein